MRRAQPGEVGDIDVALGEPMSMPTMIVANDVPRRLAERFSRGSLNVLPRAVAGTPALGAIHNFLPVQQSPESYEANMTCVAVQHGPRMSYAGRYGSLCVARLRSTKSPTRPPGSEGASGRRGIGTGEPIPQGASAKHVPP